MSCSYRTFVFRYWARFNLFDRCRVPDVFLLFAVGRLQPRLISRSYRFFFVILHHRFLFDRGRAPIVFVLRYWLRFNSG